MKLLVVYGTSRGQTAKIAWHIAQTLREHGDEVDVVDGRTIPPNPALAGYGAVIVGASVRAGRFQRSIRAFVRAHRAQLERIPSAFFSVSLSEADPDPTIHARLTSQVNRFLEETGWHPDQVASFAGSIAYLRVHWLMRLIWPRHVLPGRREGSQTRSGSENAYEYTDWQAVARFADEVASAARSAQPVTVPG